MSKCLKCHSKLPFVISKTNPKNNGFHCRNCGSKLIVNHKKLAKLDKRLGLLSACLLIAWGLLTSEVSDKEKLLGFVIGVLAFLIIVVIIHFNPPILLIDSGDKNLDKKNK